MRVKTSACARASASGGSRSSPRGRHARTGALPSGGPRQSPRPRRIDEHEIELARQAPVLEAVVEQHDVDALLEQHARAARRSGS
jgi:hypothetical protein